MFQRGFMDYHKDRFEDFSLMVYRNGKLVALLPANRVEATLYSHQGLTYGGLLLKETTKFRDVIFMFKSVLEFLSAQAVETLALKLLPSMYSAQPNDELNYLLFLTEAQLTRRDALSVLNMNNRPKISRNRMEGVSRGQKYNLIIREVDSFDEFWNAILTKNLQQKHAATPVHSLEEISALKKSFPKQIRQFNVYQDNQIVAGTTIFETETLAHSQYISGNEDKNTLGSLDFLHWHLIEDVFKHKAFFDFGTSNEHQGKKINEGLQYWKEGFGARTITQDFYSVNTKNHKLLDTVML